LRLNNLPYFEVFTVSSIDNLLEERK